MKHLKFPRIIAHRGANLVAPENTLAALYKAAQMGAKWVEFDVMLTSDCQAIIMHDVKLDRTTNGRGKVNASSWQTIQRLDAGSWFSPAFAGEKVPSLEDFVKTSAELGLGMNIEMKGNIFSANFLAEHVVSVLARYWRHDLPSPLVSSFSVSCLKAIYKRSPEISLGWISSRWWRNMASKLEKYHCLSLSANEKILTRDRVQELLDHGKHVLAYTVDDPHRARELLDFGVDGIFSNNPHLLG